MEELILKVNKRNTEDVQVIFQQYVLSPLPVQLFCVYITALVPNAQPADCPLCAACSVFSCAGGIEYWQRLRG